MRNKIINKSAIYLAVAAVLCSPVYAEEAEEPEEEKGLNTVVVTGSRRVDTVQSAPINVTALSSDVIQQNNLKDLSDIARWVPGLSVPDQGGRNSSPIIVRGLNTNSSGPGSDGGTVATYVGEIPFFVDIKLLDLERVEVLIGPQGTLYGAGTLGGAIRYIPKEVELDNTSFSANGNLFSSSEADSMGNELGFVFNTPIIDDELAIRIAVNRLDDPGFIDYNYLVREGGVSLPDPDWSDASAVSSNLTSAKDANGDEALTGKISLRWQPNETIDATLNYYFQDQQIEGRSIVHYQDLALDNPLRPLVGEYESAYRYLEPMDQKDTLLSLEMTADLEFADLVYAVGRSEFDSVGQRDQTDLLIFLDYSYEEFPAFSAFTREEVEQDSTTHELRLVSKGESNLSWIAGAYFNEFNDWNESREFTPGYANFVGANRPDDLEYISAGTTHIKEQAFFGELSYQISEQWDVTVGTRFYEYEVNTSSAIDLPLLNSWFNGAGPDEISLDFEDLAEKDDGNLLKFNTSYQFNDEVLGYFTASEGFRIGGANGVAACPDPLPNNQIVCALPSEQIYTADTTTNYEIGMKSSWLDNRLQINAAIFSVDWEDAQVAGATENGQQPIIANADGANSSGFEISSRARISDELSANFSFARAKAELTADAPSLFGPGIHAFKGDRLSGASEDQVALAFNYGTEVLDNKYLELTYGVTYQSDVYSKVGLRDNGEVLPGYSLSNLSAELSGDDWTVTFYIDNVFDEYAVTSVRSDQSRIVSSNGSEIMRSYGHFLTEPRTMGIRFNYLIEN